MKPEAILVAIGANLGDPLATADAVVGRLRAEGGLLRASSPYLTEPVGGPAGQPDFINAVVLLRSVPQLPDPQSLLRWLLQLEHEYGRQRTERWSARTLDLDLLAWGERQLAVPGLSLPHPRLHERPFVLAPLAELWPDWRHPGLGATAPELLAQLDQSGVTRLPARW